MSVDKNLLSTITDVVRKSQSVGEVVSVRVEYFEKFIAAQLLLSIVDAPCDETIHNKRFHKIENHFRLPTDFETRGV